MQYTTEVTINLPRERVIELFDNPEHLSEWQEGLQSLTPISGEPRQPGAKTKLVYKSGGRTLEMVETVESRNLPEQMIFIYETDGVHNRMVNHFFEAGADKTRWVVDNEFNFSSWMMKIMGWVMPWMFRRQTKSTMNDFKTYAENV